MTMKPKITIIVSPRERFSYAQQSLKSIYTHTTIPFHLVYVDGGSPPRLRDDLKQKSQELGFDLIRTEHFLAPNQARNLGLAYAPPTEYVLFIDNDVEVSPNWLKEMVACADETAATVVCPLTCIGRPLGETIHLAGGEARIVLQAKGEQMQRRVHEKHYFVNRSVAAVKDQLKRQPCEFAEFHCMLVRRSIFDTIGPLDEKLLSTREHIDFCLRVIQAQGTLYCEPNAVVTYVPDVLYRWYDLAYFMLRWSDDWEMRSLKHFRKKWNLPKKDKYFRKRYRRLGYRRHQAFLKPWVKRVLFGHAPPLMMKPLIALERQLNRWVSARYNSLYADHASSTEATIQLFPSTQDSTHVA